MTETISKIIKDLWFKRRDIVSKGFDESLQYLSEIVPFEIHEIPSGTECWTWEVPEKWSVEEAYIEDLEGNRILKLEDHPLHVVSYSLPVDRVVSKEELMDHLHSKPERPGAIPFEFKYYERDWGFCIQHNKLEEFTEDKYKVLIDSHFDDEGALKVGDYTIEGESEETIVVMAHLCHPAMVNDDLTGVAVLTDIARKMSNKDTHYTYKFLLVPETIGSIAYLSQNDDIIPKLKYGIFLEMLGNNNNHALQLSRQGNTKIDRIARYIMSKELSSFREGSFRNIIGNDEMVLNGPGVNVPTISISRYPYPEYHSSHDNPSIISKEKLKESKKLILDIIEVMDNDYIPKRKFKGPVFLSGYDLWVDWRENEELNKNIEQIMLRFEGDESIFDIAEELDMEFYEILEWVNKFLEKGLIKRLD